MNKKRFVDNDSFTSTYRRRASVPEKFAPNEISNINISSKKVRTKVICFCRHCNGTKEVDPRTRKIHMKNQSTYNTISSTIPPLETLSISPSDTYSRMQFSNEYYNQLEEQSILNPNESINQNFVKFSNSQLTTSNEQLNYIFLTKRVNIENNQNLIKKKLILIPEKYLSDDDEEIQEKSDQENNKESDYNESELDSEEECEKINFDLLETEENSTELSIKNYTYEYN